MIVCTEGPESSSYLAYSYPIFFLRVTSSVYAPLHHVLCQLCMMIPIGVFELRWESEIQPQGLRQHGEACALADATSKMVEKRGYPRITISPTFCLVVPTCLIFSYRQRLEWFAHHILWSERPPSPSQLLLVPLCVAWHGVARMMMRIGVFEAPMRRKDLTARSESACMAWCLTQCVVPKWLAGDLPLGPWYVQHRGWKCGSIPKVCVVGMGHGLRSSHTRLKGCQ